MGCRSKDPDDNKGVIWKLIELLGSIIVFRVNERAIRQFLIREEKAGITSANFKAGKGKVNSLSPPKTVRGEN